MMLLNTSNTFGCFIKTLHKIGIRIRYSVSRRMSSSSLFMAPETVFHTATTRQMSVMENPARQIEERKITVDGVDINYARVGRGDHPVLFLPGTLGTIWTDFKSQIEGLDINKFTIVAWDPPGYGKSRPPDRDFPNDFLQRDAAWAHNLMKKLGYEKFSLVGWSTGGTTSLVMASTYPKSIHKLIVLGSYADIYPSEMERFESLKDINALSEKMRVPLIQVYGEDYMKKIWCGSIDVVQRLYKKQNGIICKNLWKIKCQTLIIHGAKDTIMIPKHSNYIKQNIANSRLYIFENGGHTLHLKHPHEFNNLITNFLMEQSKIY